MGNIYYHSGVKSPQMPTNSPTGSFRSFSQDPDLPAYESTKEDDGIPAVERSNRGFHTTIFPSQRC